MNNLNVALSNTENIKYNLNRLQSVEKSYPVSSPKQFNVLFESVQSGSLCDDKLFSIAFAQTVQFKETQFINKLEESMHVGRVIVAMLYSYRGVSRGIPQAQNQEQANRTDMYKAAYDVLKPEIRKMKDLSTYCDECVNLITTTVRSMAPEFYVVKDSVVQMAASGSSASAIQKIVAEGREFKEAAPSSDFMTAMAQMLDLVMVIDLLKNSKASLNNDFSIYKRTQSNLKNLTGEMEDETMENHLLHAFLGSQNVFSQRLKDKLIKEAPGFEDLIVDLVNFCATSFENKQWVKPSDKWMLLKCIVYGLWLIDFGGDEGDVTKRKRLRIDRMQKIIKANPVVPFFGDLSMVLASFFVKTPRLASLKFEHDPNDAILVSSYSLLNQIDSIRSTYFDFVIQLKATQSQVLACQAQMRVFPESEVHSIYSLALKGVQLMSDWTSKVLEQSAWKFANPVSAASNKCIPEDASLYELAVRYNYSVEERCALVECIGMIKSLAGMFLEQSSGVSFTECIYKHVYLCIQSFIRTTLKDMVQHLQKKKKPSLNILQSLYSILNDRFDQDVLEEGVKKPSPLPQTGGVSQLGNQMPSFVVGGLNGRMLVASLTQIHYVSSLLESLINERSKGMQGGFLKEKDFKDQHVQDVSDFVSRTHSFAAMLNFDQCVLECSDMSELWYKEFYLEVTKQIQFPIEMSLPWILAETVLDSESPDLVEYLMYPLEIYNDAANRALHHLRSRFLYDELEAELNLCFDQFIWKLAQKVFTHFKIEASSLLLDTAFKKAASDKLMAVDDRFDFVDIPYGTVLQQKTFQLLGRHINISKLVAQHCEIHLRQSLDVAVSRYEASEFCSVIELERLIQHNKYTHKLLSQFMVLEPFESFMAEVDEETSLVTFNGRIVAHSIQELLNDFTTNYCYNSFTGRFVRTPLSVASESQRPPLPKTLPMYLCGSKQLFQAHNAICQLYKDFIGVPHFEALYRIFGAKHLGVIVGEMARSTDLILKLNVTPYVQALMKGMPHSTKLPPFEYGPQGAFDYFSLILKPLISYRDLRSGVFQVFREVGNYVLFFMLMDVVIANDAASSVVQYGDLVGEVCGTMEGKADPKLVAKNVITEAEKLLNGSNMVWSFAEQADNCHNATKSTRIPSMLKLYLEKLKLLLVEIRPQWEPQVANDDLPIEHSEELYRLWSGLLFAYAIPPPSDNEYTNRDLFGDSPLYAGTTLIHCFNQSKRFEAFDFLRFFEYMVAQSGVSLEGVKSGIIDLGKFIESTALITRLTSEALNGLGSIDKQNLVDSMKSMSFQQQ
ncbi:hypothetical protein MP228_009714 [Amoeboaphelidium protococcarum]|nr:hypothetical protein MP228_009714 [Amoeboaphelidium protococcarum]